MNSCLSVSSNQYINGDTWAKICLLIMERWRSSGRSIHRALGPVLAVNDLKILQEMAHICKKYIWKNIWKSLKHSYCRKVVVTIVPLWFICILTDWLSQKYLHNPRLKFVRPIHPPEPVRPAVEPKQPTGTNGSSVTWELLLTDWLLGWISVWATE